MKDHTFIPSEDRDFFILLRAGLWQSAEEPLSPNPDWRHIYKLACEQTVQGILADGIGHYIASHPDWQMHQQAYDAILEQSAQIVRQNYKVNQVQEQVTQRLAEQRIPHAVVKGQAVAQCYPKPMLRCSGDIDILIPRDEIMHAQGVLTPLATKVEELILDILHQAFFFGEIEVELHGTLHPNLGPRVDNAIDALQKEYFENRVSLATFNAVFIYLHALQHYNWSGLGLRQICDWTMHMHTQHQAIDHSQVEAFIARCHLEFEWELFRQFAIEVLGAPEADIPKLYAGSKCPKVELLWESCRKTGNMGHAVVKPPRSPYLALRIVSYLRGTLRKYTNLRKIAPDFALASLQNECRTYWNILLRKLRIRK